MHCRARKYPFSESQSPRSRHRGKRQRSSKCSDVVSGEARGRALSRHHASADEHANSQMREFLDKKCGVDQPTITDLFSSPQKKFLMSAGGSGICMASKSWLAFCGFGESDILGKDPKALIQGPLTSKQHISEMRDFFRGYKMDEQVGRERPSTLVINDLVNYRNIGNQEQASPFAFTLTVSLLKSKDSGSHFKIWESVMTNERDLTIAEHNQSARVYMHDYLQNRCQIDSLTAQKVQDSGSKEFLMDPSAERAGICMASEPWLSYCGLEPKDVLDKTPEQLMQGELTSRTHIKEMHDFFSSFDMEEEVQQPKPKTLVCRDLINYRKLSPTQSPVPFMFTLTVSLLKNEATGENYKVWRSVMSEERDLTPAEILEASLPSSSQAQPQPTLEAWQSVDDSTCFECSGVLLGEVRQQVIDCLQLHNARTHLETQWSLQVSVFFKGAPLQLNLRLCKPRGPTSGVSHVASMSRIHGSALDFCDFCALVKEQYYSQHGQQHSDMQAMELESKDSSFLQFEQWVFDPMGDEACMVDTEFDGATLAFSSSSTVGSEEDKAQMETYVQIVGSDAVHPSTRTDVALTIAQLCTSDAHMRRLFLRGECGEADAAAVLGAMLRSGDTGETPEMQRCALSVLLALLQDEALCASEEVLRLRGALEILGAVRQLAQGVPSDLTSLAKEILPFITKL